LLANFIVFLKIKTDKISTEFHLLDTTKQQLRTPTLFMIIMMSIRKTTMIFNKNSLHVI